MRLSGISIHAVSICLCTHVRQAALLNRVRSATHQSYHEDMSVPACVINEELLAQQHIAVGQNMMQLFAKLKQSH